MMSGDYGWEMMGHGFLWWLLWGVLIVTGILMVARSLRRRQTRPANTTPLEALQQRYANGEITTEEYEERRRALEMDRRE